ncbi:DUF937 domain-containing protein [Mycobacterium asiaticum]|uniref:DUF937 domain-containing protein n=1 Tax=Mycobacterium asiaticum TaxID=1790 RepID=A0A1A3NBK2_MYCAS|nr:DUF937 domain-containing protein [Mycobacterium asiaticum]OBK19513.1 hypothetical protein A5636_19230 [Mycobacterium asiaticum]
MADLDDLYQRIPTAELATRLGTDQAEIDKAVHTLVPVLLSGLQQHSEDPEHAGKIESAASGHAARGLLDAGGGGPTLDQVDENDGHQTVSTLFGGKDTGEVASALASGGTGNSELFKQLLPVVLPIVLAYIGKQLDSGAGQESSTQQKGSGGLSDILGSILGGGNDKPLGGILGSVLGGKGGGLGNILGGLFGGKK